jgi:DNA-binding transcriptional LysR family regulator
MSATKAVALQGCGLAYVWEGRVRGHIAAGTLVQCLDDWCVVDENLFLYYPSRRYVSAGLRALIELLKC